MEVAALGLRVDGTKDIEKATGALDNFVASGDKAEKTTKKFGDESSKARPKVDGVARASGSAARNASLLARAMESASKRLSSAAKEALAFGAAAFGIKAMMGTLAGFEQSMAAVAGITRATGQELASLRDLAKEVGESTEFSASQAADGIKFLGMAGFNAQQTLAAYADVVDLATAAQMDLATAADISSNIMAAFGIAATDAAKATDVIAAVATQANTDVQQLGDAMTYVGPVAAAMGISINDTAAAIGVLSDAGLQGSMAGTGLRRILSSLANPTKAAEKQLAALGLSIKDLNPTMNSTVDIIDKLAKSGIDAAEAFTIFGDRGAPAVLALVENRQRLTDLTASMNDVEGAAKKMANTFRDNLMGDFKNVASATEGLVIALGEAGLISALRYGAQLATEMIRSFSGLVGMVGSIAGSIGNVLAPAINLLKPALMTVAENADILLVGLGALYAPVVIGGIATLTTALGVGLVGAIKSVTAAMLANPIGLLVAGVVAAGYAVYKFADDIEEIMGVSFRDIFKTAGNYAVNSFTVAYEEIKFIWDNFGNMMGAAVVGGVNLAIRAINGLIQGATSGIDSLIGKINNALKTDIGLLGSSFSISELESTAAKNYDAALAVLQKKRAEIMGRDTIGGWFGGDDAGAPEGGGVAAPSATNESIIAERLGIPETVGASKEFQNALNQNSQAIDKMGESLYLAGLKGEELAVAQARLSLNEYATPEQIAMVEDLARAIFQVQENSKLRDKFGETGRDADKYILGDADPLSGGLFDDQFARYDAEAEKEQERYRMQMERLVQARELQIETNTHYDELEAKLKEDHAKRMGQIDQARSTLMLTTFSDAFGAIAGVLKQSHGEQSGIYRAMFAASKAFAVANATINAYDAISKAWNSAPFPANLLAVAATAPQVMGVVSAISGTGLSGMAHDGIDSVPQTGTWLLEKGERVTTAGTSAKLDRTLERVDSSMRGGNSVVQQAPIINVIEDASKAGTQEVNRNPDGTYSTDIFVANIRRGGREAEALEQTYGLRRGGV